MMKKFLTILIAAIVLVGYGVVDCYAAARPNGKKGIYLCQGRDGEATGDLDSIDITGAGSPNAYDLIDGDSAMVVEISGTSGDVYFYVFDADGTDANDDPEVIRPNDYSSGGVWRLVEFHANGFTTISTPTPTLIIKDSDATDADNNYSLGINATDTGSGSEDIDITERIQIAGVLTTIRFVNADGSYQVGTVSMPLYVVGSLELGHASDTTIARSGAGTITVEGTTVLLSGAALGTPASGTLTNCSGYPSASTTTSGIAEHATTAETSTGTDTGRIVTPDGLSGSVYGQKEIGWTIHDSDASTAVADGKQSAVIPASMNGMDLIDVTCSIADQNSASGGTTTVVLRRVRAGTPQDMTSTGVTIAYNEYTASDEVVNTSYDDVQTGDNIYVDINAVTTGAVHLGLSCTAVFQTP